MTLRVSDGEREGYGPSQTGKHQHVLKTKLYLRGSAEVEQEREDVDVDDSTSKNGHLIVSYMFRQGYILHTGLNNGNQNVIVICGKTLMYIRYFFHRKYLTVFPTEMYMKNYAHYSLIKPHLATLDPPPQTAKF